MTSRKASNTHEGVLPTGSYPRGKASTRDCVLVVDDQQCVREAVRDVLRGNGLTVVEAPDGAVAIDLLHRGLRPALILLDLSMTTMDGRAFRVEQAKDPALRRIPTVVITGSGLDPESLGQELDGVQVIAKPITYDDLLALVSHYCSDADSQVSAAIP
jgi:CheY-like chemotaxis protein